MDDPADFLKAVQQAMRLEGIPEESIEHVINRLVYGDPHGPRVRHCINQDAQVQVHVTMPQTADPALTRQLEARIRDMSERVRRGELG